MPYQHITRKFVRIRSPNAPETNEKSAERDAHLADRNLIAEINEILTISEKIAKAARDVIYTMENKRCVLKYSSNITRAESSLVDQVVCQRFPLPYN